MCTCLISAKAIRRVPSLIPGTGAVAANSERKTFHFFEGFSFFVMIISFYKQRVLCWVTSTNIKVISMLWFPGLLHILVYWVCTNEFGHCYNFFFIL